MEYVLPTVCLCLLGFVWWRLTARLDTHLAALNNMVKQANQAFARQHGDMVWLQTELEQLKAQRGTVLRGPWKRP